MKHVAISETGHRIGEDHPNARYTDGEVEAVHRKQAIEQAKERKAAWMLMSKIAGTSEWLIQRQHQSAVVWRADA